jgi:hypothetical protein
MGRRIGTAVGVVVIALLAIVLVGGTGSPHAKPLPASTSTSSPTTSSSSSTTLSTSSTSSTSTTSTIPGDTGAVGFVPSCSPKGATSFAPITTPDGPELRALGPIGAAPAWSFALPHFRFEQGGAVGITGGRAQRIPGGFLVSVSVDDPSLFTVAYGNSILMAVNDNGSVRWRQCRTDGFTGFTAVADVGDVPTQAIIAVSHGPQTTNAVETDYRVVDLADGHDAGNLHDRAVAAGLEPAYLADQLRWIGSRTLVFSGQDSAGYSTDRTLDAHDRIVQVDLRTMTVEVVHLPGVATGLAENSQWLILTPSEEPAVIASTPELVAPLPKAVFHRGRWLTEATAGPVMWRESFPRRVTFRADQLQHPTLFATDADGRILWERGDLVVLLSDGVTVVSGEPTALAIVCAPNSPGCADQMLVGVDTATGADRWQLMGTYAIAFVADGLAMVRAITTPGGVGSGPWQLIAAQTGTPLPDDQQWVDPQAFLVDPGALGVATDRVEASGAFVLAAHGDRLSVWMPKALTGPTRYVSLT